MSAKCLVVDDSTTIRKVIGRMFEKMDFEVREAENGQVALESCLISMPEVIMLDWNMPVMSGIDFLRELRKTPGGDAPKVILCTTENEFEAIQTAMSEGANEYIMKPFNEEIIKEKLEIVGVL
ncbi:MAG: response regulator [Alphaproteobacteria bacterium]|nr:response regulator [Alphaproteobacteria bacterium]NCQ67302.1 response regulator [Alphaproteobacteria bacterium]NCT06731.1 response regulator [Alphaproteobacteria bacterium]